LGRPIKSVTIVGGGTSGWIAAAFLSRAMAPALRDGSMKITLIESPKIPIIGVGEATSPALRALFQYLGVNERVFIRDANVAFKLSGYFEGWNVDAAGNPVSWFNPFLASPAIAGRSIGYYYNAFGRETAGGARDFSRLVSSGPALIDQRRGPRRIDDADYQARVPYAYHFDAMEVALQLRDLAKANGVHHILDDVNEVNLDDRGFVSSLTLEKNGDHPIELVIDSTGFAGVIINKALGEPFDQLGHYLPNDRAAAVQIPHEAPLDIEPVSRATALSSGWRFTVPLYNRIGTGYVFSSQFISDDDAITELKAHIGPRVEGKEPRIIRMRIGKSRRSWVNNCVAIGLSSGFAEPLEATAIHSVDLGVRWLYSHFPDSDFAAPLQNSYNTLVNEFYDEVIDFIVLHYHLNNRTDSEYWRVARQEAQIPDSLKQKLELWRLKMPSPNDLKTEHFFNANNYLTALMGKGFYDHEPPQLHGVSPVEWRQYMGARQAQDEKLTSNLPGHVALLKAIRGETAQQPFGGAFSGAAPAPTPMTFNFNLDK